MSDSDAGEITRPDIPAAMVPGADPVRSSGFHPRQERELAPYTSAPVLTARLNEPTIPDAALKVSMAKSALPPVLAREHTPSGVNRTPRSGTRNQAPPAARSAEVVSTVPPPRVREKPSLAPEEAPSSDPPQRDPSSRTTRRERALRETGKSPAQPDTRRSSAPAPEPQRGNVRAFALLTMTAVLAAVVGVGMGNGSLPRLAAELRDSIIVRDAAPLVSSPPVRPSTAQPKAAAASPAPVVASAPEAPNVPTLRLDQLPAAEPSAKPVETKRTRRTHRR